MIKNNPLAGASRMAARDLEGFFDAVKSYSKKRRNDMEHDYKAALEYIQAWADMENEIGPDRSQEMAAKFNHVNEAIETLRHALRSMQDQGWQPIETAPKDGTKIRCIVGHDEMILHWDETEPDEYDPAWVDDDLTDWSPTHWKPPGDKP